MIEEKKLKDWLVEVLYPTEFRAGGPQRTEARKRITSRLYDARNTNRLAPSKNGLADAATFFQWACEQRGWDALLDVKALPKHSTVLLQAPSPATEQPDMFIRESLLMTLQRCVSYMRKLTSRFGT